MNDFLERSYYALVWNTSLKRNADIRGKLIDRNTRLPQDETLLYGTNDNDVMKIKIVEYENEISYNAKTMKQSVKFNPIVEEFILPRDIRIVVWDNSEYMNPTKDKYRIMSPEYFTEMVSMKKYGILEELVCEFDETLELISSDNNKDSFEKEILEEIDFQFEIFEGLKFDNNPKLSGLFG